MWILSWVETTEVLEFMPVVKVFETREEAQELASEIYDKIENIIENDGDSSENKISSELYFEEIKLPLNKEKPAMFNVE